MATRSPTEQKVWYVKGDYLRRDLGERPFILSSYSYRLFFCGFFFAFHPNFRAQKKKKALNLELLVEKVYMSENMNTFFFFMYMKGIVNQADVKYENKYLLKIQLIFSLLYDKSKILDGLVISA